MKQINLKYVSRETYFGIMKKKSIKILKRTKISGKLNIFYIRIKQELIVDFRN